MSYKKYLHSKHWKTTKFIVYATQKHNCIFCGDKQNLNIHHKTYKNKNIGCEALSDLSVLCKECHFLWHKHFGKTLITSDITGRIRKLKKLGADKKTAIAFGMSKKSFNKYLTNNKRNYCVEVSDALANHCKKFANCLYNKKLEYTTNQLCYNSG